MLVWLYHAAFEPLRLNWGDPWSDANVLTAIEYSAKYGFLKTSFTDVLDVGPLTAESYRYTHYPPFSEILYGLVRRVVGKADIGIYRLCAITSSAAGLAALHVYVKRVFGVIAAAMAVIFFATNALFLQYADSIHQAPVLMATGMGVLAASAAWLQQQRTRSLVLVGSLAFLCFLTAYDYYFFIPVAVFATALLLGKRPFERVTTRLVVVVATGGLAAIVVKSLFVSGALGWEGFKADFAFQFLERATTRYSAEYRFGIAQLMFVRLALYLTPLFFVLVLFHAVSAVRKSRAALPLVFLAAGAPFLVVFSQLTATQVLPTQCLVPYYAIGFAVVAARLFERRVVWGTALVAVLVGWQTFHVATFEKSFLARADAAKIEAYLEQQDHNDFVFTNLLADGPIQYYFHKHLMPVVVDKQWALGYYRAILDRVDEEVHFVFFDDPNTRFIDKSLWPLVAPDRGWHELGAPPWFRASLFTSITRYDDSARFSIEQVGRRIFSTGQVTVYALAFSDMVALMKRNPTLQRVTETIDFGDASSDDYKLHGIRGIEPGHRYAWLTGRNKQHTVLTSHGVEWRDGPLDLAGTLLVRLQAGASYAASLRAFSAVPEQTIDIEVNGHSVLREATLGLRSSEISFVVPSDTLDTSDFQTLRITFRAAVAPAIPIYASPGAPADRVGVAVEALSFESRESNAARDRAE